MRRRALLPIASAFLLAACAAPAPAPAPPPVVPPPAAKLFYEEPLPPAGKLMLEISGLDETRSEDRQRVTVTGMVINRGTRPTSELRVEVQALDAAGKAVLSTLATPSTERIAAGGGVATFSATLENRPEVRQYHVEATGR